MKKIILSILLITPLFAAKSKSQLEEERRQVETRAATAVGERARVEAERDARDDHCGKVNRGLAGAPGDCAALPGVVDGLHVKLDGAKNYTATKLRGAGVLANNDQISASQKLDKLNSVVAAQLAYTLWRFLDNLRNAGAPASNDYDYNAHGGLVGAQDLSTFAGWLGMFNADIGAFNNRGARMNARRDLLVSLWALNILDDRKINDSAALANTGGTQALTIANLADAIAEQLWVMDHFMFTRILNTNMPEGAVGGWVGNDFDFISRGGGAAVYVVAAGIGGPLAGAYNIEGVDYARVERSLKKLMGHP